MILWVWLAVQWCASALRPPLTAPRPTALAAAAKRHVVVGVNKYSHDASCCIVDAQSGELLFAQAKERYSRVKHDGGSVAAVVQDGLQAVGASLQDVALVVSNNHHHRVLPFERRLPFATAIRAAPAAYLHECNLFPGVPQLELSHHLAHAWCGMSTAPFARGLVLVMDGMGESYRAMIEDMLRVEDEDAADDYMHDLKLLRRMGTENFVGQPTALFPGSGYREAETAYAFDAERAILKPVFKRWARERSPPELYNHGFENLESVGAVYSRISSHILGDWNACGKVMGLSAWANKPGQEAAGWYFRQASSSPVDVPDDLELGKNFYHRQSFMKGSLLDGSFQIDWKNLGSLESANAFSDATFGYHANLAHSVQTDLEEIVLNLAEGLHGKTGEENLVFVGGVALNSVLNAKLKAQPWLKQLYVPPAPGDEGIALGCAMYGLQRWKQQRQSDAVDVFTFPPRKDDQVITSPDIDHHHGHDHNHGHNHQHDEVLIPFQQSSDSFTAYQGRAPADDDLDDALYEFERWIDFESFESAEDLVADAVRALTEDKAVIAWYQGRSELGQRALGGRSILADPRIEEHRRFINAEIKEREWFRPLAPSVLDEYVGDWFEGLESGENASPYMSITARIKEDKVKAIPAVAHIDNTARLQTVTAAASPLYHQLLRAFFAKTGVPMVLNTSLNRKKEPIVETARDAILTLIASRGKLKHLYLGQLKITLKPFPVTAEHVEAEKDMNVFAQRVYLSRITTSSQGSSAAGKVLQVQVQDALVLAVSGEDERGTTTWRTVPSELHLEILQLLQPPAEDDSRGGELSLNLLWSAVQQLRTVVNEEEEEHIQSNSDVGESDIEWSEFQDALEWLYYQSLVSFEPSGDGDEKEALSKLLGGVEVLDLR